MKVEFQCFSDNSRIIYTSLFVKKKGLKSTSVYGCQSDELAAEALNLMERHQITMLPVVDEDDKVIGMLHMHDLIRAGIL